MLASRTWPTVRKRCDSKYFFVWFATTFFLVCYWKSWPEVPILFQNLRSELVYTFKWTKSVARLWRNQICEWTLKKKKSPYLPTHRWNGGSGAGNEHIFKGGLITSYLPDYAWWDLWQKQTMEKPSLVNFSAQPTIYNVYK